MSPELLACLALDLTQPAGHRMWGKSFNLTELKSPCLYLISSLGTSGKKMSIKQITEQVPAQATASSP